MIAKGFVFLHSLPVIIIQCSTMCYCLQAHIKLSGESHHYNEILSLTSDNEVPINRRICSIWLIDVSFCVTAICSQFPTILFLEFAFHDKPSGILTSVIVVYLLPIRNLFKKSHKQTGRRRNSQLNRQTDRQTKTDRQTDR